MRTRFTGGLVIHGSEAIVFLASLVAFWGLWKWIGWSFLLIVLGTVQIGLAPPDEDRASGWVHGLHGLGALARVPAGLRTWRTTMRDCWA